MARLGILNIVGLAVVLGAFLFVTGTYVNYTNLTDSMQKYGAWSVETAGSVQVVIGSGVATIYNLTGSYTSHPTPPTYGQYLTDMLSSKPSPFGTQPYNETVLFKVRVIVTAQDANRTFWTLFDQTNAVRLFWNGGQIGIDGTVMTWDIHLGPYIDRSIASPVKLESRVLIDGSQKAIFDSYMTLPHIAG